MNEIKNYGYIDNLGITEYFAFPIYIAIILFISYWIQKKHIKENIIYKYYTRAVTFKLIGAIIFCIVYIYVYKGGDTISYFESARAFTNLFFEKPSYFFKVMVEGPSPENFYLFDGRTTGYPWDYMYYDTRTLLVIKLLVPFMLLSFQSYVLTTILFSWISFIGIWKLYIVFSDYYKKYHNQLAISILFLPSAIFWGSGILKDTITLSASCWYIYTFYKLFILKENRIKNFLILLVVAYVIFSIKPYILYTLLPGSLVWGFYEKILNIKSRVIRYMIIPVGLFVSIILVFYILTSSGTFDINSLLSEASEKQTDLKQSYYAGNTFDIGSYEPTITGALGVSPAALTAGLFRPFIWESKNVVMLLSGIENFIYLLLSILILFRFKFGKLIKIISSNPLLLFCLIYSLFFSLIVGLSTANFGALVRFRIAYLPEFVSFLLVTYYLMREKKASKI